MGALAITIDGSDAKFLDDWFAVNDVGDSRTLNAVRFADGTTWDYLTLRLKAIEGSANADDLRGYSDSDDTIDGLDGDDFLAGMAGNDFLIGGPGNDTLSGGAGIDTYFLQSDGGHDVLIFDADSELDTLQVAADIDPGQVRILNSVDGLWIFVDPGTSVLDTGNAPNPDFGGDGPGLSRITFADGSYWDSVEIRRLSLLGATDESESIDGYNDSEIGRAHV